MIAVLDTAGVEAFAMPAAHGRARLRVLMEEIDAVVVPAGVLAEGLLTGNPRHDVPIHRLINMGEVHDVDRDIGLRAGALRHEVSRGRTGRPPSGVDAIVAAVAEEHAAHQEHAQSGGPP